MKKSIVVLLVLVMSFVPGWATRIGSDGSPKIYVEWHIPSEFIYGEPNPLCFTICNNGGYANGENNLWISGYETGLAQWTLETGACFLTGWKDDFYVQDKHILPDEYVELRFYVKMWNDFGTDTYDETRWVHVIGLEPVDPCPPECYGCDYWAMKCIDGECEKDYIIESNSEECGCGEEGNIKVYVEDENGYDIEDAKIYFDEDYQGKTDSSGILKIYDVSEGLHTVEAEKSGYQSDGETVRVIAGEWTEVYLRLIKEKPKEHDVIIVVRNNWDAFTSTTQYFRELVICCSTNPVPDEISITIEVTIPDDAHVDKVVLRTSEPLKQGCGDLQLPDEDTFILKKIGSGLYKKERISSCETPFIEVMEYLIDKLCGGCLGVHHIKPEINGEVWIYFSDGTQPIVKKLREPLPTIYDAYDSLVDRIRSNDVQIFIGGSSIDLTIVDTSGRKIGASYSESGVFLGEANEIADGVYSGRDVSPEIIVVPQCGQYTVYVNGTGTGNYSLKVIAVKNNEAFSKTISGYITEGKRHEYTVTCSSEGVEIQEEESDNGSHDNGTCSGTILIVAMLAAGIVGGYRRSS